MTWLRRFEHVRRPIQTSTLDRLAQNGLRYTQFHTTAVSSPTRAAVLTGRNHHSVHTGTIMETATGFPGYDSLMGKDTATVAEILKQKGWNTAWFGKNHNVPDWQTSQAGPFDLWPTGLGFEYFYGFLGAETNQWRPAVFEGTKPIEPYLGNPDYNFDYDMADKAIEWVRNQKAVGRTSRSSSTTRRAPRTRRITQEGMDREVQGEVQPGVGQGTRGDARASEATGPGPANTQLTIRHAGIQAWDTLNAEQKQLFAYMMEIYAGYLEQTDYNVGRVLDAIEKLGQLDNTLVMYTVGDNGASAEGTLQGSLNELANTANGVPEDFKLVLQRAGELGTWKSHNHYPVGWAHAMDTPFQWAKQVASHYGGTRNGMVISWPAHIKDRGGIRTQWHHAIDIVPTILDVAGLQQPSSVNGVAQKPVEGVSMAYTFDDPKRRRRTGRNTSRW